MDNLIFIALMLVALLAWHRAKVSLMAKLRRGALVKRRASGVNRGSTRLDTAV